MTSRVWVGIDLGGSTYKLVAFDRGARRGARRWATLQDRASQASRVPELLDRLLADMGATKSDVERASLTGVGSPRVDEEALGVATTRVAEFDAVGMGGMYACGLERGLVTCAGTGTSFVLVDDNGNARHLGGSGCGGGSLVGTARLALGTDDVAEVCRLASAGRRAGVDLLVSDLVDEEIPGLPSGLTAANLALARPDSPREDVALCMVNATFETVGMMAVMACKGTSVTDVALVGSLMTLPQACGVFDTLGALHGLRFHIPRCAAFAPAMGAVAVACGWRPEAGEDGDGPLPPLPA